MSPNGATPTSAKPVVGSGNKRPGGAGAQGTSSPERAKQAPHLALKTPYSNARLAGVSIEKLPEPFALWAVPWGEACRGDRPLGDLAARCLPPHPECHGRLARPCPVGMVIACGASAAVGRAGGEDASATRSGGSAAVLGRGAGGSLRVRRGAQIAAWQLTRRSSSLLRPVRRHLRCRSLAAARRAGRARVVMPCCMNAPQP